MNQQAVTFDEKGQTIGDEADESLATSADAEAPGETSEDQAPEAPPRKYVIGDREFATQEEALQYAQAQEEIANAYRQGLKEGITQVVPGVPGVTPPAPQDDFNEEEYYANPKKFLDEFKNKIKEETRTEVERQRLSEQQTERVWRAYTDRHPDMADFRSEVEAFVQQNQTEVAALAQTKGEKAAFDYITTKLKTRFAEYASVTKPKRELPNGGAGTAPNAKAASVTPKAEAKKPSTFADEIRKLRKRR